MADVYTELRELIAAECHDQWTGWMDYLFSKAESLEGIAGYAKPAVAIPHELVLRWRRQCLTKYADLSEQEKNSDRVEADKIIKLLNEGGYIAIPKPGG